MLPSNLIVAMAPSALGRLLGTQAAFVELLREPPLVDRQLASIGPDFGRELLLEAVSQYKARERRFGGLPCRSTA